MDNRFTIHVCKFIKRCHWATQKVRLSSAKVPDSLNNLHCSMMAGFRRFFILANSRSWRFSLLFINAAKASWTNCDRDRPCTAANWSSFFRSFSGIRTVNIWFAPIGTTHFNLYYIVIRSLLISMFPPVSWWSLFAWRGSSNEVVRSRYNLKGVEIN